MHTGKNSDDIIRDQILRILLVNGEFDAHNVEVDVEDGVVTIEGDVSGRHAKRVTEKCLSEVDGIKTIENRLKVRRISRFSDNSMHGF
ncbi:MAG: BON domain-containing protein [Bacteriovoracaceae bacterium]